MCLFLWQNRALLLKNKLKQLLTGLSIPQEYICLDIEGFQNPLFVFLTLSGTSVEMDVTSSHLFLGYKPLVIGIPFPTQSEELEILKKQNCVRLKFSAAGSTDDEGTSSRLVASLDLKMFTEKKMQDRVTVFFEGTHGQHYFLNPINRFINHQRDKRRNSAAANINLDGNLYDQVRIAYAVPRIISIITVSDGHLINMFPTDLHGVVGEKFYLSSLRTGGKANEQVEKFKNIVISEVPASSYKYAYDLGKNHMQDMQPNEKFLTGAEKSSTFALPLPVGFTEYRELRQIDSFAYGVHRIHIYEVVNHQIGWGNSKLVHIHQYYGQWRLDNGLRTDMLFR